MTKKVLVLLPTYNEVASVVGILEELDGIRSILAPLYELTILNIDDASPDGTAALVRDANIDNIFQLNSGAKIGLGPAYISGFIWGLIRDFDLFVQIDADGSHLVSQLPDLLEASNSHDLVIGTRWIDGGRIENWPWYRRFISKAGTRYASAALGLPISDLTSGYRVLNRRFLEAIDLNNISTKGYGFQIEIAMQAFVNAFSIAQVPITFIERSAGKSKMTTGIVLEAFGFITKRGFERISGLIIRR